MKTLIEECNANVDAVDKDGNAALHLAASSNNVDVIDALLSYPKCNVNS